MRRLLTVAVVLVPAAMAMAQAAPPQPSLTRTAAPWVGFVLMFVMVALVMGVSLMPAKRGHQD